MTEDPITEEPTQRCADCGRLMPASRVHSECRHCRKCVAPARCGHNHDQWPDEQ